MKKKLLVWLALLALLLAGCTEQTPIVTTTEPTTQPTIETTDPFEGLAE